MYSDAVIGDVVHVIHDDYSLCTAAIVQKLYPDPAPGEGELPGAIQAVVFPIGDGVDSMTYYWSDRPTPQTWHLKEECTRGEGSPK